MGEEQVDTFALADDLHLYWLGCKRLLQILDVAKDRLVGDQAGHVKFDNHPVGRALHGRAEGGKKTETEQEHASHIYVVAAFGPSDKANVPYNWIVVTAVIVALTLARPAHAAHQPKWVDSMLAGYALLDDEKHRDVAVYDEKTGFFIVREAECDGGLLTLLLTRDRSLLKNFGFRMPGKGDADHDEYKAVTLKPLPSLSTGKGVAIGDTCEDVEKRLGKPTKVKKSGASEQFLDYVYSWKSGKGDYTTEYDETYTFKAGKLIQINFFRGLNV